MQQSSRIFDSVEENGIHIMVISETLLGHEVKINDNSNCLKIFNCPSAGTEKVLLVVAFAFMYHLNYLADSMTTLNVET